MNQPTKISRMMDWFRDNGSGTVHQCAKEIGEEVDSIKSAGTVLQHRGFIRKTGKTVMVEGSQKPHSVMKWVG